MIRADGGVLVILFLAWGGLCLFAGMSWATWDARTEHRPRSHDESEHERRLRWRGDRATALHDQPTVVIRPLPYDRTREDVPI